MSNFENRGRITFAEAMKIATTPSSAIDHILDNGDGTFSVMSHIVCEFCDYCAEQKGQFHVFPAKANPYEEQNAILASEEGWGK